MARKPIHLEMVGKLTPRDRIWAAIRATKGLEFKRADIADWVVEHAPAEASVRRIEERTIESYLDGLIAAGFLRTVGPLVRYKPRIYALARDVGIEAPRVNRDGTPVTRGGKREAMWRAMKILKTFDRKELRNASSTDVLVVQDIDAKDYIIHLAKAGYLQLLQAHSAHRQSRYRFVPSKNTGPRAPIVQTKKHVYDPNLGQVVWHPEVNS